MDVLSFPFALDRLACPGVIAALDTPALGAVMRLAEWAWHQDPPGFLIDDASLLASVARMPMTPTLHTSVRMVFTPTGDGRLYCEALALMHAAAAKLRHQRKTAGIASGAARARPPDAPAIEHPLNIRSTGVERAFDSAAISRTRARAERSSAISIPEISESAHKSAPEVLAKLESAGAQESFLRAWRARECEHLLRRALQTWAARGQSVVPEYKARELASTQHATPARVQTALDRIAAKLELPDKDKRRCRNPFGLLVTLLGAETVRPSRPIEPDLLHVAAWDRREEFAVRQARAQIAMDAAVDAARPTESHAATPRAGGTWAKRLGRLGGGA